jgi:hypothetical protein
MYLSDKHHRATVRCVRTLWSGMAVVSALMGFSYGTKSMWAEMFAAAATGLIFVVIHDVSRETP